MIRIILLLQSQSQSHTNRKLRMGIFRTFSKTHIVPVDTTIHEQYLLRCITKAIRTTDAGYLTSALISLTIAHERCGYQQVSTDDLLDALVSVFATKCNMTEVHNLFQNLPFYLDNDENGATGYSLCIFQSAALVAYKMKHSLDSCAS